jgi:hypothetical protein
MEIRAGRQWRGAIVPTVMWAAVWNAPCSNLRDLCILFVEIFH